MALDWIATYKAGSSGYYADHQRGTVDVWHDSKRYVYRKPFDGIKKFKREILAAFGSRCVVHISGSYPDYEVTTDC